MKTILLSFLFLISLNVHACLEVRAAYDIGSGSTKMKVALVDSCLNKIVTSLQEKNVPVAYKESLKTSVNSELGPAIKEKGLSALRELKKLSEIHAPVLHVAIATAGLREAKNGEEFAREITDTLGIETKMISQETEAKLGFAAAMGASDAEADNMVSWDIGGGSMQMVSYETYGGLSLYQGLLASVSFKDLLISTIQKKDPQVISSPNPISIEDLRLSGSMVVKEAQKVNPVIVDKIKSGALVIGIGGVHSHSIRNQLPVPQSTYTLKDLKLALKRRLGMTDAEVGGAFASTEISNLILVYHFMRALGIQKVELTNINLADGLLLAPELIKD